MAIPPWAIDVLRRGVGGVMDRMPPEKMEMLKEKASNLLAELPQTAARGVDSVMRTMKSSRDHLHRWAKRHTALVTPIVNGTGCLTEERIAGVPVGHDCLELLSEVWLSAAGRSTAADTRLAHRIARSLPGGGQAMLVAHSLDAALAAISGAADGVSIYVHRHQSFRLAGGLPIPDAIKAAGSDVASRVQEIGAADRVVSEDLQTIQTSAGSPAILVAVDRGQPQARWFDSPADASSLPAVRVCLLLHAKWTNASQDSASLGEIEPPLPSVQQALADGADLVVIPGDGVLGGPRCGVLVGNATVIERIRHSARWTLLRADIGVQAAMVSVLNAWTDSQFESIPVVTMLQTSAANLQSRGQRLMTRLMAEPLIAEVALTNHSAQLCPQSPYRLPSVQLRMRHRDLSAASWAEKLANEVPALLVKVDDQAALLDLRWIQPVDDVALVAALIGHSAAVDVSAPPAPSPSSTTGGESLL